MRSLLEPCLTCATQIKTFVRAYGDAEVRICGDTATEVKQRRARHSKGGTAKAASAASPSREGSESSDGCAAFPGHPAPALAGETPVRRADALDQLRDRSRRRQGGVPDRTTGRRGLPRARFLNRTE